MSLPFPVIQLGDLCDVLDSKRRPITKRDRVAGEYPYYGATGILGYVEGFIFDEPLVLIGEDGAKWGAGENTAFSAEGRYWVNNHAHVIRPHREKLLDSWLIYQLNQADLSPFITGLTVPKLNQAKMREIPIIVPPLDEQRRIVAVLDKAFAGIATATANAQKNLTNARALFESYAEALIAKDSGSDKKALLKSITDRITNGYVGPTRNIYVESGIPYLLARQVKNNTLKFDLRTYISPDFNEKIKKSKLLEGDVLLVQSGHIGHSAVVPIEHKGHNCHAMIVITPKSMLIGDYLSLFFNTAGMKRKFAEIRSGSTVPHLTCKLVRELMIPLPSVPKQMEIVEKCSEVKTEALALESYYGRKLAALTELKQSLLHKAFAGELT